MKRRLKQFRINNIQVGSGEISIKQKIDTVDNKFVNDLLLMLGSLWTVKRMLKILGAFLNFLEKAWFNLCASLKALQQQSTLKY